MYTASDPEANAAVATTITWSTSGRDGGDFTIDRQTGVLTFRTPPDHERPADSNRDNVYEVAVRAHDGRNYGNFDVTVTVLAVNEGPKITGKDAFSYREKRHFGPIHLPGHGPRGRRVHVGPGRL